MDSDFIILCDMVHWIQVNHHLLENDSKNTLDHIKASHDLHLSVIMRDVICYAQ